MSKQKKTLFRNMDTFKVTPITLMASFTCGWLARCASSSQTQTPREQMAVHLSKEKQREDKAREIQYTLNDKML